MDNLMSPFSLFIIASVCTCLLAVIVPFSLWYYLRAKEIAPLLTKKMALETIVENLKRDIHIAHEQLDKLTEDLARAKDLMSQGNLAKQWLEENKKKIEDLQKQIAKVNTEYECAFQKQQDMANKVSNKQLELAELNKKLADAQIKNDKIWEDSHKVRNELESDIKKMRVEKEKLEIGNLGLLTEEESLTKKVATLRLQVQDMETQKENLKKVLNDTQNSIQIAKEENKRLRDEMESLEGNKIKLENGVKEIESKIENGQKMLNQLAEDSTKRREELESSICKLMSDKYIIEADIKTLVANKESQSKESKSLLISLNEYKKQEENLRQTINEFKKDIAFNQGEVKRLMSERDALKVQIESQKKDAIKISDDTQKLIGQAQVAQQLIAQQQAIKTDSNDKWKNLDLQIFDEKAIAKKRSLDKIEEKKWLDEFMQKLTRYGFIFNPRAIKAFHTSLKCAQSTPLVVLSGISGTGKSLLPELYSAALGMNFLPVPIQPRWDSPQDLFGFYNYMEGRYKATELSRLLWQYDIYNTPNMMGVSGDNLPMNLILLDEMNLARVEYYFSDLLSKLAMRNGLNEYDAEERKKAEIELECNAADKVESTRHIFVSPRSLFVGTMNEDESTQMLSDKVIDRANVLRFGRPKNLDAKPDKGAFLAEYRSARRISANQWDSWCVKLTDKNDTSELKFLRETLAPVADALDFVNRPYGFRVDNAMKTYILNYPGSVKEAVADQIEMKVLPKLNGVELDSDGFQQKVKGAILEAIDKTGEGGKGLREAFIKSCPDGATFFKWRGVMR